jgi:hypothetical protein
MSWNLEGLRVKATYLDMFPVTGVVTLSRVAYGGSVNHHITLDTPITVYGAVRDSVIIEHSQVQQVMSNNTEVA